MAYVCPLNHGHQWTRNTTGIYAMAIVLETHLQTSNKQIMHTLSICFLSINEPWKCMNQTIWTSQDMNMVWSNKIWELTKMNIRRQTHVSIHASVDAIQGQQMSDDLPTFFFLSSNSRCSHSTTLSQCRAETLTVRHSHSAKNDDDETLPKKIIHSEGFATKNRKCTQSLRS